MRVLVTHPGRQHSHQLAHALHQRNELAGYWTGVPAVEPSAKGPLYRIIAALSPQPTTTLPRRRVDHNYVMPLTRRIAERVFPDPKVVDVQHRAAAWFDAWAAQRLLPSVDAVVAYENAARKTFQAARTQGTTTILDAASFHHEWQDAFHEPIETDRAHRRINRRKDAEIERADHILTVSEFARESYVDAGVSPDRVTSIPMGAELSDFTPGETANSGPFTFIFAGYAAERKGIDVLLSASEQLTQTSNFDYRVQFVGGFDDRFFENRNAPIERMGYLKRHDLAEAFRRADCLVLPSRHDSFGRVVVEAMATGLPAIVSDHVGAKEAIKEGKTGWVVPAEDVDALAERMRWCIKHPEQVRAMHDSAVRTAKAYSWEAYRDRVTDVLAEVVEQHR